MAEGLHNTKWAAYEKLAHKIVKDLLPLADVMHDDHILGRESEDNRQIDVSARWRDGEDEYLLIVQVKDLKRRADVNVIGTFRSVIQDVGAHKGVLICSGGFSKAAKTYARNLGILLYALHDAQSKDWALELTIPIVWVGLESVVNPSFTFAPSVAGKFGKGEGQLRIVISDDGGQNPVDVAELFQRLWNSEQAPREPGMHTYVVPGRWKMLYQDASGSDIWGPVSDVTYNYTVTRRSWLGQYRPQDCRGLIDFLEGDTFVPTYVNLSDVPMRRDESWTPIEDPDKVALNIKGVVLTIEAFHIDDAGTYDEVFVTDLGPAYNMPASGAEARSAP